MDVWKRLLVPLNVCHKLNMDNIWLDIANAYMVQAQADSFSPH